jgi:hypothetical protein
VEIQHAALSHAVCCTKLNLTTNSQEVELQLVCEAPNGLRSRSMACGRAWILFGSRKNLKTGKCLKIAQNPQRPVHVLLGRFCKTDSSLNLPHCIGGQPMVYTVYCFHTSHHFWERLVEDGFVFGTCQGFEFIHAVFHLLLRLTAIGQPQTGSVESTEALTKSISAV